MREPSALHVTPPSSKSPLVSCTAFAGACAAGSTGTVKMWRWRVRSRYPAPLLRNIALVTTRTSHGGSAFALSAPPCAPRAECVEPSKSDGLVELLKAIVRPSGDHSGDDAPRGAVVSWCASPPLMESR